MSQENLERILDANGYPLRPDAFLKPIRKNALDHIPEPVGWTVCLHLTVQGASKILHGTVAKSQTFVDGRVVIVRLSAECTYPTPYSKETDEGWEHVVLWIPKYERTGGILNQLKAPTPVRTYKYAA